MNPRARKAAGPSKRVVETTRKEENLSVDTERVAVGGVRARKQIDYLPTEERFSTRFEDAEVERSPAPEGDSGQVETLADGSISIPLFEERLVVEKRLFVRERVVIRKNAELRDQIVTAELGRERIVINAEPQIADRVLDARDVPRSAPSGATPTTRPAERQRADGPAQPTPRKRRTT